MTKNNKISPVSNEAFDFAATIGMLRETCVTTEVNNSWWQSGPTVQRLNEREMAKTIKDLFGPVRVSSGAYRSAVIFPTFVVKYPRDNRVQEMYDEYEFITTMRTTEFARHFPITQLVEIGDTVILIQERINMSHRGKPLYMLDQATRLAEYLGIDDMHDGNFGWKGPKGREYPVFVDVDLRAGRPAVRDLPKKRSWMI